MLLTRGGLRRIVLLGFHTRRFRSVSKTYSTSTRVAHPIHSHLHLPTMPTSPPPSTGLLVLGGAALLFIRALRRRTRTNPRIAEVRRTYDLSPLGFLMSPEPQRLTATTGAGAECDSYFEPWESLSARLPALVKTPDALRAEIDEQLPCLDAARLTSTAMLRRAYVLLGQLVHGYCFASADAPGPAPLPADGLLRVPPQLAKPWHQVCDRLGLPCVLTAIGVDAWNWQRIDPAKPIELGNITCLSTITGTRSEVRLESGMVWVWPGLALSH